MTAPGGRTLATAFLEIRPDSKIFRAELHADTQSAGATAGASSGRSFASAMKKAIAAAGVALAVGTAFVGLKALEFLKDANRDASDLNETVSKAQNVFPKTQAALNTFAATSARALGLSRQQALEGAASFGQFFSQIGIGEKTSLKMSTALLKLSADLGSFNNADPSEVMNAFLSATRGEYDALQRFIPTINAATVQAEAMRLTHKKSTKDLTEADKALALYQLSLRGTGKAQNDFAETARGQANATRTWQANLADIRAEIGTALLPVTTQFINALNDELVPVIKELWAEHGPEVTDFLSRMVDNLSEAGPFLSEVVTRIREFFTAQNSAGGGPTVADNMSAAADSAKELLPVIKEFIAALPSFADVINVSAEALGFLADHTDELRAAMPYLVAAVIAYKVAQLASNIATAASPVFKVLDVLATRRQTAAIEAQTAALVASRAAVTAATTAQVAETTAQNAGILARVRAVAGMVAHRVATVASTVATWAMSVATTAFGVALKFALGPIGLIITAIALLVAGIIWAYKNNETFRKIVQAVWKAVQIAVKATVDWIVNVAWPFLKRAWDGIVAAVKFAINLWIGYLNLLRSIVSAVFRWVVDFVRDRINFMIAVVRTVGRIYEFFRDAFNRARQTVVDTTGRIIDFVRSIPGRILSALGNLGRLLLNAGRDIINGLLEGIRNKIDDVKNLLKSVTNLLPDWKGPLDTDRKILGPSGEALMTGFIAGIRRRVPDVRRELADVTRGLQPAFASGGAAQSAGGGDRGITVKQLIVKAFSDRFSLKQVQEDLAMNGVH